MPPGPAWQGLIADAWEAGAAILPLDHRLPVPEVQRLLRRARPMVLWDEEGGSRLTLGVPTDPEVALVVATSGTAGEPRLAELGHSAIRAAVDASAVRLGSSPSDGWLLCLPVAHMGGMLVLLRGLLLGAPITIHEGFDVDAFAAAGSGGAVQFASVVPTMLTRLVDAATDLSGFRALLVGGQSLPRELRARAEQAGARVVETYGLTESCGGVVYEGHPFDGIELGFGADAEILLRGPTLFRGYREDPDATAAALTDEGWLRTRDAGELVDGRLVVHGRLDDAIITGGEKVWPEAVERVLREHPDVADALVSGEVDPEWGERVVASIVPVDPASPPTLDELRALVAERMAPYAAPHELRVVDALLETTSGKIRRPNAPPARET